MGRVNTASLEPISAIQQEVLVGTLLGDGRLECRSKNGSARLRIHHADSQKNYVRWKYDIFQNIVTKEPWKVTWIGKQTSNKYAAWFFHTKTLSALQPFHQLFYPSGKKLISKRIGKFLTPLALATWFMDDGCMTNGSAILNTQCFTLAEHAILQELLKNCFSIESTINKDRNTYRLRINKENTHLLDKIIYEHVPNCMQYKLAPRND